MTTIDSEVLRHTVSRRRFAAIAATATGLALALAACGADTNDGRGGDGGGKGGALNIAYQPNFGYAPLMILKKKRWLEESLPEAEVGYQRVNSGGLIRSGMIAGDIQVGAMALSPFLVGWDKGVDWKVLSALSDIDQWLMVNDARLKTLHDFTPADKIAVLSADNNQAILLRIAAQKTLGNAAALEANMVYMPQDTGAQSLLTHRVAAHFTNPPYQFQERDQGARRILGSYDIFGGAEHSPIFGAMVVRQPYFDSNPAAIDALKTGIGRATEFLATDPEESAAILAEEFGEPAATISAYLKEPDVNFTTEIKGVLEMAAAMREIGVIQRVPESVSDVVF